MTVEKEQHSNYNTPMSTLQRITISSLISASVAMLVFVPTVVWAVCTCTSTPPPNPIPADEAACTVASGCTWATPATTPPTTAPQEPTFVELVNPLGGTEENKAGVTSVPVIIGTVIKAALGVAGSVALVAFVYGSFVWLTSAGKSDKIQEGSRTMLYAVIGLFIIFSAYGILNQVIGALTR